MNKKPSVNGRPVCEIHGPLIGEGITNLADEKGHLGGFCTICLVELVSKSLKKVVAPGTIPIPKEFLE